MTSSPLINVARTIGPTNAEGPGSRLAIWVQGCNIRCDGCFNPHLWTPQGGTPTPPAALIAQAKTTDVEGITLLGGEPFDQAEALSHLAGQAQDVGLTVMTFTGHTIEHLEALPDHSPERALLRHTDLLVDGPYVADNPDHHRPWVGSTNQRFHFLTDRYRHLEPSLASNPDRVEIRVAPDGTLQLNGWAATDHLDALLDGTADVRITRGKVR